MILRTLIFAILLSSAAFVHGQSTAFTYQGVLNTSGTPADGNHDFEFRIFDALSGGAQVGSTLTRTNVPVTAGTFAVELNFGGLFTGEGRFLEIAVSLAGGQSYTTLAPRSTFTSAPYAIKSLASNVSNLATNANQLGGVAANQYVTTSSGNTNYIQNQNVTQQIADFSINGTASANQINSSSDYRIAGFRVLGILGENNLFAGVSAGENNTGTGNTFLGREAGRNNTTANRNTFAGAFAGLATTSGSFNSFFGNDTGRANTTGGSNAFFGSLAGDENTTGSSNSFFGHNSGSSNTIGRDNSFFGSSSGTNITTGVSNSFFGAATGRQTTTGIANAFFGVVSGDATTTGSENSFLGPQAGQFNTIGSFNTFVGSRAGRDNTTGTNNTTLGTDAAVGANNLTYATAIGAGTTVSASNTLVLGRAADTVQIPGTLNSVGMLSGAIVNAGTQLNINGRRTFTINGPYNSDGFTGENSNVFAGEGAGLNVVPHQDPNFVNGRLNAFFGGRAGIANTGGFANSFFGASAGSSNVSGSRNSFFGRNAGRSNTGSSNTFVGMEAGYSNTSGFSNTFVGISAGNANSTGGNNTALGGEADIANGTSNATAIGAFAFASQDNSLILGGITGVNGCSFSFDCDSVNVGIGTTTPHSRLDVRGDISIGVVDDPNGAGGNNLYIANDGGDANNVFRLDGSNNNFFMIARSNAGSTSGAGIVFRTSAAGGGETTRMSISSGGTVDISGNLVHASGNLAVFNSPVSLVSLSTGGTTALCRNPSTNFIATCSSSLRYKTNINRFSFGVDLVKQLEPITFDWKDGGMRDFGLGAEDVAAIEPLLVTYNKDGQVEGVKYDRIGVVLVNAVKEQQAIIERQQKINDRQQEQINELTKLFCASNNAAAICEEK